MEKPIPAFYCCYLLRSRSRRAFYIGSTPNPARRLNQHNGASKGGAKRTSMQGKRPWEMTCIVTGFPSHFAALQFEFAWQNSHLTRHIDKQAKEARAESLQNRSKKTGGRRSKPPVSLEIKLKDLHQLLGVDSFKRWPLQIRFFAPDVFTAWEKHTLNLIPKLRSSILVHLTHVEVAKPTKETTSEDQVFEVPDLIRQIPVAYEDAKPYVEKARVILADKPEPKCRICTRSISTACDLIIVCPVESCPTMTHVTCLASRFRDEEPGEDALVPTEGTCPGCRNPLKWATLMKELTLRTRGRTELEAMFKPKRRKHAGSVPEAEENKQRDAPLDAEDTDLDDTWLEDVDDEDAVVLQAG